MMRFIFGAWGIAALFAGFMILGAAQGAIHETEAGLAFLIGTVGLGVAAILEVLTALQGTLAQIHAATAREGAVLTKAAPQ